MKTCGLCNWAWAREKPKFRWRRLSADDEAEPGACFIDPITCENEDQNVYYNMPACSRFKPWELPDGMTADELLATVLSGKSE